jgi:hypothetical protein
MGTEPTKPVDAEVVEEKVTYPKTNATMALGRGILFQSVAEVWAVADGLRKGGAGPKGGTTGSVAASIIKGQTLGLDPITSMSYITVVNGRASLMGDLALGLVRKSGLVNPKAGGYLREVWTGEGEARTCTMSAKRHDTGEEMARSFSVTQARAAGLLGKTTMWTAFQDRMLRYRALGFLLRDLFSDILLGLYLTEELQSFEPPNGQDPVLLPVQAVEAQPDPFFEKPEAPAVPALVASTVPETKLATPFEPAVNAKGEMVNRDGVTLAQVMDAPTYEAAVASVAAETNATPEEKDPAEEAADALLAAVEAGTLLRDDEVLPAPAVVVAPAPNSPADPFRGFRDPDPAAAPVKIATPRSTKPKPASPSSTVTVVKGQRRLI